MVNVFFFLIITLNRFFVALLVCYILLTCVSASKKYLLQNLIMPCHAGISAIPSPISGSDFVIYSSIQCSIQTLNFYIGIAFLQFFYEYSNTPSLHRFISLKNKLCPFTCYQMSKNVITTCKKLNITFSKPFFVCSLQVKNTIKQS